MRAMNDTYFAFWGQVHLASGPLDVVLTAAYPYRDSAPAPLFFDATGRQADFDWRGTLDDVLTRASPPERRPGPGRPKLGVRAVEVTLLPRHWAWLNQQPSGASGTLRRLVDAAMAKAAADPAQRAQALGRMLWAIAGNEPNFEDVTRALYAADVDKVRSLTADWPGDLPRFIGDFLNASAYTRRDG